MKDSAILTKTNAIRLGAVLLGSYITLLIGLVYLGQIHLRQSLLEQSRLTIEKQATAINYFLNEQQDQIKEFTKNPTVNAFFANRAMGMSMEYGLRASLEMIRGELKGLCQRKKLLDQPVYSNICFVDGDGTILASAKKTDKHRVDMNSTDIAELDGISLHLYPNAGGGYSARYTAGITYRHQLNGLIIADIDLARVILPLLQHSKNNDLNNSLMLIGPDKQVLVSTKPVGKSYFSSTGSQTPISIPLGRSGYFLEGEIAQNQKMLLTSPWFLSAIALLSFPVVGGLLLLVRLNNNHLLLQVKFSASQQQKKLAQQANSRVNAVLAGIDAIVYVTDMETSKILYSNAAASALYGDITGKICWQALYRNQGKPCSFCVDTDLLDKNGNPNPTLTMEFQHSENKRWFHSADCAIPWDDGRYVHLRVATDITSRIKNEQALQDAHNQLETLAYYDPLTRLANRRLFIDRLNHAFPLANRTKSGMAICYLDLDKFKDINDVHGHETGDQLLIQFGDRLLENLRAEDTVARWGGDEFALLINDQKNRQKCAQTLTRLIENLVIPYEINGNIFQVTTSIGVTLYPKDGGDPDMLLRHADQAMYIAKQQGRNRYHFFDPEQDRRTSRENEKIARIATAISKDELCLFYQPKIDMATGEIIGAEALVRWQHPDRGLLSPIHFLPLIEGHTLQSKLDEWVLRCALRQVAQWQNTMTEFVVSINISAQYLQKSGFVNQLKTLLAEFQNS